MSDKSIDNLGVIADLLQVGTFVMTLTESSNDRLMKELQHQNKDYLEIIVQQNKKIIDKLERIENVRFTKSG